MDKRQTVNIGQASEFLGCSRAYIYRLYELGKIEGYRLGERRGIRFFLDSLQEFVNDRLME